MTTVAGNKLINKMSNDYFAFKQFTVRQQRCAMKVGTDGCLVGAWAQGPLNKKHSPLTILDIGTGTGLIALMMAQRFPEALITAVDVDADAVQQARENVAASPFSSRITVVEQDIAHYSPLTTHQTPFRPHRQQSAILHRRADQPGCTAHVGTSCRVVDLRRADAAFCGPVEQRWAGVGHHSVRVSSADGTGYLVGWTDAVTLLCRENHRTETSETFSFGVQKAGCQRG